MSQFVLQYAVQILPIFVGALVLVMLKGIKISRSKIVISADEEEPFHLNAECENCKASDFHSPAESFFYDSLLISGRLCKNLKKQNLEQQAFEDLGYITEKWIPNMPRYVKNSKSDRLTLFVNDVEMNVPMRIFSQFNESAGLLLWYAVHGNMEVRVYA